MFYLTFLILNSECILMVFFNLFQYLSEVYRHIFFRPGAQQMTQPAFPSYSLYSPQQLLWLQHIYAQQYYMQ